jgi:hypothetical protein
LFQKVLRFGGAILWYLETDPFVEKAVHGLIQR